MTYDSDAVIKCLAGSRSAAVKRLISQETGQFNTAEVLEIELVMYQKLPQGANIGKMQSALRYLISARDPDHDSVNKAAVAHRYPTSSNPHANGLLEAERTYGIAVQWLERALNGLGKRSPSEHASTSVFSLFATFIVASILDFEFLHADFIPALIEALQQERMVSLNRAMIGVSLSLRHGQQENAEARLLIARGATATLLRKLLSHSELKVALDRIVIPGTKPDQVAIIRVIDQKIASIDCFENSRATSELDPTRSLALAMNASIEPQPSLC